MRAWFYGAMFGVLAGLIGLAVGVPMGLGADRLFKRASPDAYTRVTKWCFNHPWLSALITGVAVTTSLFILQAVRNRPSALHPLFMGVMFFAVFGLVGSYRLRRQQVSTQAPDRP